MIAKYAHYSPGFDHPERRQKTQGRNRTPSNLYIHRGEKAANQRKPSEVCAVACMPVGSGAILHPPSGVDVLGKAFVRIEGVSRACQEQYTREGTGHQHGRNGRAGPAQTAQKRSARSYVSHVVPE